MIEFPWMGVVRNHTLVMLSVKDFFFDSFARHGLCIFSDCQKDSAYVNSLPILTILLLLLVAIVLAILRHLHGTYLTPYLADWWKLKPQYRAMLPETSWKLLWSFVFFLWTFDSVFRKYP